ncbi:MAG TPA: pyridoxal-dependent decarboxylase [Solirubrobacteraceae bacterium]|jgi:glutamate/tyrosine decarboxylase-like PLP-dependent enzyme|nr:pyridoxal-dependent decarboxylase [Solirubrobacteraceae bacterium]
MDSHLRGTARQAQRRDPESPDHLTIDPFAKFPAREFNYLTELDAMDIDTPATEAELLDEVAHFFRGAQRPESPYCLFNTNVLATVDATAAACLATMQNLNCLMDMFGGESLLVEQKVARTIGRWAGWPESMGIACHSGKVTMQYALRLAIARAQPASSKKGIVGPLVVLSSASAHYSVEHVAASVGIGAENCVRVPVDSGGRMSSSALWTAMKRAHAQGATIAAVVCCGGTIVDFSCDDTAKVHSTVDRFTREHSLAQRPYLHFDSVLGWLYFAFRGVSAEDLELAVPDDAIRNRIAVVTNRCSALGQFDSLGVDFHKTGLCAETNSFFIAPDRRFMDELGTGDYKYQDADFEFGNFRAYRYTFENSRPSHGILAAWVNLRMLGRNGFGEYLVSLHQGRAGLEQAIERHGQFTVLNHSNLGWEVLFHIPFEEAGADAAYDDIAIAFMEHCWRRVREGRELPLFSIVPEYHIDHDPARSRVAFLLYPMNARPPEQWDAVIAAIARELRRFEQGRESAARNKRSLAWEKPIR